MTNVHQVQVTTDEGRPPVVSIALGEKLLTAEVEALAAEVTAKIEELSGNPFTLLIDTRAVKGAEQPATVRMQQLESELAGRGLLKIAHVVRFKEMGAQLQKAYEEMGAPDLIGTFLETDEALAFLSRARVEA
jgi:hypothetical protein